MARITIGPCGQDTERRKLNPLVIAPGGTIGILGGGQLGRMLALAAARLGLKTHIYCPNTDTPAAQVSHAVTIAAYDDGAALDRFGSAVDVVTYEFENIPVDTTQRLETHVPVLPGPGVLRVAQDRQAEKQFFQDLGIATARFAPIGNAGELAAAVDRIGFPAILKTRRMGYDGKGQVVLRGAGDVAHAWDAVGGVPSILEGFVDFEREISVIAARAADGTVACYDAGENQHGNHILDVTRVPAGIAPVIVAEAAEIATRIADALDYVGVLAVEMFVCPGTPLIVNEIAPRVHNTGHWTLEACAISQFEQHIRAICGWPLGDPARHSDARMCNLIGTDVDRWADIAAEPGAALHLYGKDGARPGRKMGHITKLFPLGRLPAS